MQIEAFHKKNNMALKAFYENALTRLLLKTAIFLLLFYFPYEIAHYIFVLLHHIYEGLDFLFEELLVHGFGLTKFQSHLVFFYSICAAGLYILYWLWRKMPTLIKKMKHQYKYTAETIANFWYAQPVMYKIALVIVLMLFFKLYILFLF